MAKPNQRKLLILFSALFFAGFLYFIPQRVYAASVFTAGWYEDKGTGETDTSCLVGKWRARVELRDDLGEPLLADKLTIRAIWYEEGTDIGVEIYRAEAGNLTTSTFETDCAIDIKSNQGTIALEVTAEKADYYKMLAANNYRTGGSAFNQKVWKKTLHLAPLTIENANISYLFPDNNEWISAREEDSEMKLWVNKAPLPDNITQVDAEIIHTATAQKFSLSQATDIAEGEVVFSLPDLTQHGYYSWRVKLARSSPSILYNENAISFFNFDPNPPIAYQLWGSRYRSGKLQAPALHSQFKDEPLPSSGICTIEVYLNDGPGTPLELVKTCTGGGSSAWCTYVGPYQEYLTSKTYTGYAIAYDCAGNKKQTGQTSFTINPIDPSRLTIYSRVDQGSVAGVPFEITNITDVVNGTDTPAIGTYQTATTFVSTVDRYSITLQAPASYNARPFGFWQYSISCYNNPLVLQVPYGYSYTFTMNFGVSRLQLLRRLETNKGSMSGSLSGQIQNKKTRIEQIGGSPANLLGPAGYRDHTAALNFYKTVTGEISDLTLRFNDSADGILKFSRVSNSFCTPDPEDDRQCRGSITYSCEKLTPYYLIQRTVRVEASGTGGIPVDGVGIIGSDGMQSGTTTADGYYTFSSTAQPHNFTGYLWAPEVILDNEGKEVEFGYWTGCQSVSADGLGCYIGTGVTWFYNVNVTVKAHYTSEPESEMPFLDINRILTGGGDGTVTSSVGSICCGCVPTSKCNDYFATGTEVTLTAIPTADSYFVGWTGNCAFSDNNATCTMTSDRQAFAEFAPKPVLTVNITGNGTVTDAGSPPSIDCPGTCSASFDPSSTVSLAADSDLYWEFTGWTGDCSGAGGCSLFMNEDKTVNALFEPLGPTAAMGCAVTPLECGGPGCVCMAAPGTWITYRGAIFNLLNESILPNHSIYYTSRWYYLNLAGIWSKFAEFNDDRWDVRATPTTANIPRGSTTLRLIVEDSATGITSTTTRGLIVKNDISADFQCSLDNILGPWHNCTSVTPLVGQTVYFLDTSTASDGATTSGWVWSKGNGAFSDFASGFKTASTTLTAAINKVRLDVTDSAGRADREEKTLNVVLPLPEYREVAPTGRLDDFLSRLSNIFVRF